MFGPWAAYFPVSLGHGYDILPIIRPYQVQVGRVEPRPDIVLDDDGGGGPRGEGADEGEEVPGGAAVAAPLEAQPGEHADEEAQEHRVRQRVEERLLKGGKPIQCTLMVARGL